MKRLGEHLIRRNQAQSVAISGNQRDTITPVDEAFGRGADAPPSLASPDEESNQEVVRSHQRPIRGPSEANQRGIRGSSEANQRVIRGSSEGHQRPIRGSSEGHQRVIRGQSEGHQRVIRGAFTPGSVPPWAAVGMLEPRPRRSKGRTMARAKIRQGPSRAPRSVPDEGRNQGSLGGTHERRFVKARLELRSAPRRWRRS